MVNKDDPWTTIPVRESVRFRIMGFKKPKPKRKKRQHIMESLNDVIVRLMDFWEENHEEA